MTDRRPTLVVRFPFRLSFFLIIIITLHSMHVATIRVDIWWVVLVTATEKHISSPTVPKCSPVSNPGGDDGRVQYCCIPGTWIVVKSCQRDGTIRHPFRNQLCNCIVNGHHHYHHIISLNCQSVCPTL